MILKKTENEQIIFGEFVNPQEGWELASENEILAYELQKAKKIKINQCLNYLCSTDWYVIRKADNSTTIPSEIITNRELARTLQDDIEDCTTLEELEIININFE